jgi:cytochrome c-L
MKQRITVVGAVLAAAVIAVGAAPVLAQDGNIENTEPVVFKNVVTGEPLSYEGQPEQEITEAVTNFNETGENPYDGDASAIEAGKEIYESNACSGCHTPDGTGGMCPSLVDDQWTHEGIETDKGKFEIIYGGGVGAMQAYGDRLPQDDILKVVAFINDLHAQAK